MPLHQRPSFGLVLLTRSSIFYQTSSLIFLNDAFTFFVELEPVLALLLPLPRLAPTPAQNRLLLAH
jgi:hypothetical protein